MDQYKMYQRYLGEIPEFLKKYLTLDIVVRLKDISLLCGMEYASRYAYDFLFSVSRYDHVVNTALITWNLTHDKKATLAALFHDVGSPTFSHVIDYMNGDYKNQESTEEKTSEILLSSLELRDMLKIDNINIEDILDFKKYSVVDLSRPCLCADRLDNTITLGLTWTKDLKFKDIKRIIDDIYLSINEDGKQEITFKSRDVAIYFKVINDEINRLMHTNSDTYMMMLGADMIKLCLELNLFTYNDLFRLGEKEVIKIIVANLSKYPKLDYYWSQFTGIVDIPLIEQPDIKDKVVNPLVRNRRLS